MDRIERLYFSNCVLENGKLYGFLDDGGFPIEIDLETKEVCMINLDKLTEMPLQIDSVLFDKRIIFILELNGKRLLQYDIETKRFECFYINYKGETWGNFVLMTKMEQYIYIFPKKADCIIKISLQKESVLKRKLDLFEKRDIQFSCAFRNENDVCLFSEDTKEMWLYDLQKEEFKLYQLEQDIESLVTAVTFENDAYLLGKKGSVYNCRLSDYTIKELKKSEPDNTQYIWGNIAVTQKNIWLLPSLGESICIIDRDSLQENILTEYPDDFAYMDIKGYGKYYGYCEDDECYYFAQRLANYMLEINKSSGASRWIKLINPLKKDLYSIVLANTRKLNESIFSILNLQDFLDFICSN